MLGRGAAYRGVDAQLPDAQTPNRDDINLPMLDPDFPKSSDLRGKELPVEVPLEILSSPAGSGEDEEKETAGTGRQALRFCIHHWEKAVILAILIFLVVIVSVKGFTVFGDILNFFQHRNNWVGWTCFLLLYTANISLFLPGILLIMGAGFVFGFWKALLAVWIGGGIGQIMAFLLARYLIRDFITALLRGKSRKWDIVDRAMELEGWKLLLLCRLSPLLPYNVLNIVMASTKIHFWPFALVSFFGIIPECAFSCYIGSLTENISSIVTGAAEPHGKVTYILAGISMFFLLLTACWATFIIRRAMKRADASLKEDSVMMSASSGEVHSVDDEEGSVVTGGGVSAHHSMVVREERWQGSAGSRGSSPRGGVPSARPYSPPPAQPSRYASGDLGQHQPQHQEQQEQQRQAQQWSRAGSMSVHSEHSSDPWELQQWPPPSEQHQDGAHAQHAQRSRLGELRQD